MKHCPDCEYFVPLLWTCSYYSKFQQECSTSAGACEKKKAVLAALGACSRVLTSQHIPKSPLIKII